VTDVAGFVGLAIVVIVAMKGQLRTMP